MKLAMLAALLALSSFVLAQAPQKAAGPQKKGDDELRACGARIPR